MSSVINQQGIFLRRDHSHTKRKLKKRGNAQRINLVRRMEAIFQANNKRTLRKFVSLSVEEGIKKYVVIENLKILKDCMRKGTSWYAVRKAAVIDPYCFEDNNCKAVPETVTPW